VKVRYTYRLRPGKTAQRYLAREWGMCRYVWNQLVAESKTRHATDPDVMFGYAAQDKFLTHLRATTRDDDGVAWLAVGSSVAQQQTVRDFSAARSKALQDRKARIPVTRRRGLPRFKKRDVASSSMNFTARGFSLRPDAAGRVRLVLPGGVSVPVVWSRDLPSDPKSVRVSQDCLGHWYASFVVEVEHAPLDTVGDGVAIGIDWGVTETATTARVNLRTGGVDLATTFDLPHRQHGNREGRRRARSSATPDVPSSSPEGRTTVPRVPVRSVPGCEGRKEGCPATQGRRPQVGQGPRRRP
jgi:putative transposase